jgi:sigma-E factor negative regulatory protein RseC
MIEQQATVIAVADGSALIEVQRQSGCSACHIGEQCGTSVVAKLFRNGEATRLRVADTIGLMPGEQVVVGIRGSLLVRASLVAYLLPLLTFIGTAGAAEQLGLGESLGMLASLTGLLLGLWLTGFITGGTGAKARFRPLLLRRALTTTVVRLELVHPAVGG